MLNLKESHSQTPVPGSPRRPAQHPAACAPNASLCEASPPSPGRTPRGAVSGARGGGPLTPSLRLEWAAPGAHVLVPDTRGKQWGPGGPGLPGEDGSQGARRCPSPSVPLGSPAGPRARPGNEAARPPARLRRWLAWRLSGRRPRSRWVNVRTREPHFQPERFPEATGPDAALPTGHGRLSLQRPR